MQGKQINIVGGGLAWVIWLIGAAAFGYAFFHRVAPSVLVNDLMRDFAIGAASVGTLSAIYFYPYAGLQLPIGVLLDRWGARLTLAIALSLASIGSFMFAVAETVYLAYLGRFLIGAGSAVGFIGTLMLVSKWFSPKRYAFLSGLTMMVAMISAVGSQAPLANAVEMIGWRNTMFLGTAVGILLVVLTIIVVRDHPGVSVKSSRPKETWSSFYQTLKKAMRIRQIWITSLVATALSGPMLAFGALWGGPYMMVRYGIDRPEAAFYASLMFVGWAIGAPFSGWLADHIGRRKLPVSGAAIINLGIMIALFMLPDLSLKSAGLLIFLSGFVCGSMVNLFAYIRELTDPRVHGAVTGIINGCTVGSAAVLQPMIGWILDLYWTGEMLDGARVYDMVAYSSAMMALVVVSLIAAVASFSLHETYCRVQWQPKTADNFSAQPA